MKSRIKYLIFCMTVVVVAASSCSTKQTAINESVNTLKEQSSGLYPLTGRIYGKYQDTTIVLLHGDLSNGGLATYMHDFAEDIIENFPTIQVISLLRTGYSDGELTSIGDNYNRRDQYTKENNVLVYKTITNIKASRNNTKIIAIGHSGGAAQLGAIIGQNQNLVDAAILVSCPCDLYQWRIGRTPLVRSQSPSDFTTQVGEHIKVIAISGSNDTNTSPSLAKRYIQELQYNSVDGKFISIEGGGHNFDKTMIDGTFSALNEVLMDN